MTEEFSGVERPEVHLPGRRDNFGRGTLLVLDLALVDRIWSTLSVSEAIAGIVSGALAPKSSGPVPGVPSPADRTGLEVALGALTVPKLSARPLAENLRAKRNPGIPWKWFAAIPDGKEEIRADDRLCRLSEVTRLPDLAAEDVMLVTSLAEREMVGAKEVRDAFSRWSRPEFLAGLESVAHEQVEEILVGAWGSADPLLAALGPDDEAALWNEARARLDAVRSVLRFAAKNGLAVLPSTKEAHAAWLAERASARAR